MFGLIGCLMSEIIRHLESFSTIRSLSAASRTLQVFLYWVPGVPLRFTPGFMLAGCFAG